MDVKGVLLGGDSPFLADLARREAATLEAIVAQGPDAVCDLELGVLARLSPGMPRPEIAAVLRTAKRRVALATALADIAGWWDLAQVTGALSDLADNALRIAVSHLLLAAHLRGELRLPHPGAPARGSGFAVLAMGKLGARELNYSSDVDLVLIFDPEAHAYNADGVGAIFARLARDLVALMQQRDAGGYVFRTDLRLRPDPGSTPPAVALATALAYYEGAAHTWERAALIKARPVAGDPLLSRRFLDAIRPFVWRRHLDFAAISDIRTMKQRMDTHTGGALESAGRPEARVMNHDVKLGQGGIREIEFCAQTLQLVWGGRNPALRVAATEAALQAASRAGHLPETDRTDLAAAYQFLRRAEHRLQMVADRQTHTLPDTVAGLEAFAAFMGYTSAAAFAAALLPHLVRVHAIFTALLREPPTAPDLPAAGPTALAPLSASSPMPWDSWLEGKPRALRTERAQALLLELLPALIGMVERQADPSTVWSRLDDLIYRLPAGVQIFSMLRHNPALLDRLGDVLGAAPSLADHLATVPAALEGLVAPHDIEANPAQTLAAQLHDAAGLDDAVAIAIRFVRAAEFRLAVAELDGKIDQDQAAASRTALADAAIGNLLPLIMADHARRYGTLKGGQLVVVALGKAGSREMMAGSDLDLMLIYDHPPGAAENAGLPPSQYFAKAAQSIIAALTAPTRDGKLYEVDMRLRPSGNKGPVAVSLAAFQRYHHESAWTYERLALTRARIVAGPARLTRHVTSALQQALREGDPAAILPDTLAMRRRLLAELPPTSLWDVKLRQGGLLEVEFIAQSLQLRHAGRPKLLHQNTTVALARFAKAGVFPQADATLLTQADGLWRAIQGVLRIMHGSRIPAVLPEPTRLRMLRVLDHALGSGSGESESARIDRVAVNVRAAFVRHVGDL